MKRFTRRSNTGRFNIAADARAARLARASAAGMISEALEARLFLSASPKAAIGTPAAGYGLLAQYYPSSDFSGTPIDRIDRSVNFAWGRGTPTRSIPRGAFSAKWTGDVIAPRTGTFTFALTSLGGAHLIINGADVVNTLGASGAKPTTDTGTVDLVAGQSYSLELDYVANGRSSVSLKFAAPKSATQVIPARSLLSGVTPPQAPSNLSAQVAAATEVDLSWQANGSFLTGFTVQRATGKGPFTTVANVGGTVSGYQDTRVRANTTYSYRVIAANVAGKSQASAPLIVKTVPAGTTPIDTSAVLSGGNAVFLSWALPPSGSNLTSFSIDRSTDGSSTWANVGSVDVSTNAFTDNTAVDGHSYIYRITAMSGSTAAPFIGTTSVNVPLGAPSGLTASVLDATTVLLQWTNNSTSATGFEIDRSPNGGVTWATLANVPAGTTSYSTAIVPGQNYAYQVRATMGANTTSTYSNLAAIASQLGAPSNVTATATTSNSVTLDWTVNSSGQTGFEIDRSTDGGATWPTVFFATPNLISFVDNTVLGAATYTYRIRAFAGQANSDFSPSISATTDLAAPTGVSATGLTSSEITVVWANPNLGALGYEVDRSPDGITNWTAVTTTAPNATFYNDTGLAAATTFYYQVYAVGQDGTKLLGNTTPVSAMTSASGTYLGLTIPTSHARLWWTPARLAQAQQWYAAHPFTPDPSDPMNNALVYQITGNQTYAQNAINSLMNFTISQDDLNGVSSDTYRWNDWVPVVFDWCYSAMTADQISTFMTRYSGYVTTMMGKSWGGPTMPSSNYFWGYLRNELDWGIAIYYEDPTDAQTFLNDAIVTRYEDSFLPWAANSGAGGVASEGSQYGRYMLQYITMPFTSSAQMGLNLYGLGNFYKEAVFNLIYATTPGPSTNASGATPYYQVMPFGEDELSLGYPAAADAYYGDFMTQMAEEFGSSPVGEYARQWLNLTGAGALASTYVQAVDVGGAALSFASLPLDYYASGPGFLYAKSGWNASAMQVDLQLGTTGSQHGQSGAGSFQIWAGGSWLTKQSTSYGGDGSQISGYGGAAPANPDGVIGQNGVLIGGLGMANAYVVGPPQVTRVQDTALYAFASTDLSQAYRANSPYPERDDNPYAGNVVRDFLYVRPLNALISLDRLASNTVGTTDASQVEKAFLLHLPNNPSVNGQTVTEVNGGEQLTLTALTPQGQAAPIMRVVNELQNVPTPDTGTDYQYRLEEVTSGETQSYLINVMQATAAGAIGLTASMTEDANSFTITLRDPTLGTGVVVFQKGMQSAGGSFGYSPDPNATPAPTQSLGTGIQGVSVTDQGPVWAS